MSDLETRLPDALRDVVPADVPRTGLAARVPELARRRRVRARLGVVAAAVVTAVAATGLVGVGDFSLRETAPAGPPPAVDRRGPYLYVLSETVPADGTVRFFVVNPTDTVFETYGVLGTVERWTSDGWEDAGRFVAATGDVPGGRVVPGDETVDVPAIGFATDPRSGGRLENVAVDGLDAGWYRFGHETDGRVAYGQVHVVDGGVPSPEPVPPASPVRLDMATVVVAGAATTTSARLTVPAASSVEEAAAVRGEVGREATVERWDGEGWEPDDDAGPVPLRVEGVAGDVEADLPALAPGTYRLVVRTSTQRQVWAPFWVLVLP